MSNVWRVAGQATTGFLPRSFLRSLPATQRVPFAARSPSAKRSHLSTPIKPRAAASTSVAYGDGSSLHVNLIIAKLTSNRLTMVADEAYQTRKSRMMPRIAAPPW